MKKITLGIAGVAATALALTACSGGGAPAPSGSAAEYHGPDVLSISQAFPMNGWDIGQSGSAFGGTFFSAVYDPLFLIDSTGEPYGVVAQNVTTSEDGLTYDFDIAPGITFTDGATLDAEGVVANLEYLKSGFGTGAAYSKVDSFTAVDEDSVEITLSSPDPVFLYNMGLGNSYLASPEAIADPGYASLTAPVGSGPYTFDEGASLPGTDWIFEKNADYWDSARWPWESIEIHVVQDFTGAGTAQNMLSAGQTNVMYTSWTPTLEADAEANGWELVDNYSAWSGIMFADRAGDVVPALGDPKVRLALNEAIDREALLGGEGVDPGTEATNQVFAEIDPSIENYAYDVEDAKALLAEAGYPDGFSFDVPAGGFFDATMAQIAQYWAEIGVTANMVQLTPDVYNQQVFAGTWPVYAANLQLYANPAKTIQDYFTPGSMSNAFVKTEDDIDPGLKPLIDQFYEPGADIDAIASEINAYVTENAYFAITSHGRDFFALADGLTVKPIQGLYVPNFQQFLPDAK